MTKYYGVIDKGAFDITYQAKIFYDDQYDIHTGDQGADVWAAADESATLSHDSPAQYFYDIIIRVPRPAVPETWIYRRSSKSEDIYQYKLNLWVQTDDQGFVDLGRTDTAVITVEPGAGYVYYAFTTFGPSRTEVKVPLFLQTRGLVELPNSHELDSSAPTIKPAFSDVTTLDGTIHRLVTGAPAVQYDLTFIVDTVTAQLLWTIMLLLSNSADLRELVIDEQIDRLVLSGDGPDLQPTAPDVWRFNVKGTQQ